MEELKRLTPEDTKEMLNSYRVDKEKIRSDTFEATITNDAEHAEKVEYGEGRIYDYHKPA